MKRILLYAILWVSGFIVSGSIIIIWGSNTMGEPLVLFDKNVPVTSDGNSANLVNELLLSANELSIYGRSGMIDLKYRRTKDSVSAEIRPDPVRIYNAILSRKLNKLNERKGSTDFFIKPVPK